MNSPTKILMLVLNLDVGGQERMLIELCRGLDHERFQPLICCLEGRGVLADSASKAGIEVIALEKAAGGVSLRTASEVRKLIRQRNIQLVHSHNNPGLLYGALATAASKVVHIHTKHGVGTTGRKTRWLNRVAGLTVASMVPVSEALLEQAATQEGIPRRKLRLIDNGVDLQPFLAIERDAEPAKTLVIGHVARLTGIKNQALLLRLFARFLRAVPAARLILVGDGPERQALEQLAEQLQITSQVEFAGLRTDIACQMARFDWFALTSRSEGTPISVIEAMAAGLPVTSTAVGGMADIVQHGVTGLLAAINDEETLLQCWLQLAGDSDLRCRMGIAARQFASAGYGIERMVNGYQDLYQQYLAQGSA